MIIGGGTFGQNDDANLTICPMGRALRYGILLVLSIRSACIFVGSTRLRA